MGRYDAFIGSLRDTLFARDFSCVEIVGAIILVGEQPPWWIYTPVSLAWLIYRANRPTSTKE